MIDKEIKEQLDRIELYSLMAAKNVLNINEAAIILGMTVRGVRENVRNRIIPCYKPNANRLYFKKSELEEWMTQNPERAWQSWNQRQQPIVLTIKQINLW